MPIDILSLLMTHLLCNAQAEMNRVSISEAAYCSSNFETLKISLHPNITVSAFTALPEAERSRVSVEAYQHYRNWIGENAHLVKEMEEAVLRISKLKIGDNS